MAINFPNAPVTGDTYTVNNVTWTYTGTSWRAVSSGGGNSTVTVSDDPPAGPSDGDMWWKVILEDLKFFYQDGTSDLVG